MSFYQIVCDMQVLETQFQQNLQMIKDVEETIRGSSFQVINIDIDYKIFLTIKFVLDLNTC